MLCYVMLCYDIHLGSIHTWYVPGYNAQVRYSLGTDVNTSFFQVAELEFGCVQGLYLVRGHKGGHWVPLCTQ